MFIYDQLLTFANIKKRFRLFEKKNHIAITLVVFSNK